jgi:hypothetical protein
MPPRDHDPLTAVAGRWHDTRQQVLGTWGGPPAHRRRSTEHGLHHRGVTGGPQERGAASRTLDVLEVRRLRQAMGEATSWEELFHLAQWIWHCPAVDSHNGRTSARAQLHIAYTRAVDRLWRHPATLWRHRRTTGSCADGHGAVHHETDRSAPLLRIPPPASRSLAGSRVPPPPPVKAKRLRRAHGAALTAAAVPALAPAIGAGGGPPQGATT